MGPLHLLVFSLASSYTRTISNSAYLVNLLPDVYVEVIIKYAYLVDSLPMRFRLSVSSEFANNKINNKIEKNNFAKYLQFVTENCTEETDNDRNKIIP